MEDVRHAFDSFALEYDTQRDHVIPELQQFYGAAAGRPSPRGTTPGSWISGPGPG